MSSDEADGVPEPCTKRQKTTQEKNQESSRRAAQARRGAGLRWITITDKAWLRCSVQCEEDPGAEDSRRRSGVKYSKDGQELALNDSRIKRDCKVGSIMHSFCMHALILRYACS
jgi:hypothetical protein